MSEGLIRALQWVFLGAVILLVLAAALAMVST